MIYNYVKEIYKLKTRFQIDPKYLTRNQLDDPNEHLYTQHNVWMKVNKSSDSYSGAT